VERQPPAKVTLPTPGIALEARLGQCDACEEFIDESRELELKRRAAEVLIAEEHAAQEQSETKRYEKRLGQTPSPLLDDPDPNQNETTLRIRLDREQP
jgi:hypothetical protein